MVRKFLLLALVLLPASNLAATPVLNFSDLTYGPGTGNSDTSLGQISGLDGAIVTLWGTGLGTAGSASQITVNGAAAAQLYYWGDAQGPYSPADLYTHQGMEEIIFQVSHLAGSGPGTISVNVGGLTSNTLPFTVGPGTIRYVSTAGSDSGAGTWASPYRTMPAAVQHMAPGDITYVRNGVQQTTLDPFNNYSAALDLPVNGLPGKPCALVAYPGATVNVGSDSLLYGIWNYKSGSGQTTDWTIAKLNVTSSNVSLHMATDFRLVGNRVTAPTDDAAEGAIEGHGNNLAVLGNEVTNVGKAGASKLTHPIYISAARATSGPRLPTESNREIAWNYVHDNNAPDGVNIYSTGSSSAYMTNTTVHDNFIINQTGGGMLIGAMMTGVNYVYNNVIANAGLGPDPSPAENHFGVEIRPGATGQSTTIYFENNTIYGCGWTGTPSSSNHGSLFLGDTSLFTLHFNNNIIQSTGDQFLPSGNGVPAPGSASNNIWFGPPAAGPRPSWDSGVSSLTADPRFLAAAAGDFHLLATSPAVNTGLDLSSVLTRDIDNVSRPQGAAFDIGAYEYVAVPVPEPASAALLAAGAAALALWRRRGR